MTSQALSSLTDQVTELLRQGMIQGRWQGTLPGRDRLAGELGCSHRTVEAAMRRLAKEGLLVSQGPGRRRRIELSSEKIRPQGMNVKVLHYEDADRRLDYFLELIFKLQQSGHQANFSKQSLRDLNMDLKRVARLVKKTPADAWIVTSAPREVLEWFVQQAIPAFALFGRRRNVPIASVAPEKLEAIAELIDRLVEMGHRRIVNIVAEERRKPSPGFSERFYLDQLSKHGIRTGRYNLPDWDVSPEGLQRLLESLFRHTPPTALLVDEPALFYAARDHLAQMGVLAPKHVSLVCYDSDPSFEWFRPKVTHIVWDSDPVINRAVQWVNNVSRGKEDRRMTTTKAKLMLGGTIGPASS